MNQIRTIHDKHLNPPTPFLEPKYLNLMPGQNKMISVGNNLQGEWTYFPLDLSLKKYSGEIMKPFDHIKDNFRNRPLQAS